MATANYGAPASSSRAHQSNAYAAPVPVSNAPPGTFTPGIKVQVGSHRVVIERYLSEGGFAHVYVVRVPAPDSKHYIAVLKRVACPDKDALASMRTEVETMKKLRGHKHIVTYIDSHASQLKGGGYEVFLLMEFCAGGGLIDFMNTRLQVRLTEPEILKILGDVCEGVATMHYLKPPLLHRDLKVENVLISKPPTSSSGVLYKLCDFGSTAPPRPAATNTTEGRLIEDDIQRHTTLQYRSPEMIDVYRKQPIDEKSDIWALGVLLYKLCYYTTPFEEVGQMAILNASFKYPQHPPFSTKLKALIGAMLKEKPSQRPNIYQVVQTLCSMRGTPVPIKDIYATRTQSEVRGNQQMPSTSRVVSPPPVSGISHAPAAQQVEALPDIAPMRRGRPTAPTQNVAGAKQSSSPAKGDPFAALDSRSHEIRSQAVDELSSKFPSVDEFTIAHDKGTGYQFAKAGSIPAGEATLNARVTNALADEVFAQPQSALAVPKKPQQLQTITVEKRRTGIVGTTKPVVSAQEPTLVHQTKPVRAGYTSTGTMTSTTPSPAPTPNVLELKSRTIWRVPDQYRASSQPRASPTSQSAADRLHPHLPSSEHSALLEKHRSKSQTALDVSSQSLQNETEEGWARGKSMSSRSRPVSAAYVDSNVDYLRDHERNSMSKKRPSFEIRRSGNTAEELRGSAIEETPIEADTDYLRTVEGSHVHRHKTTRKPSHERRKRASLPVLSLSGTKHAIAGKFGDAFRKFEHSPSGERSSREFDRPARTPSPAVRRSDERHRLGADSGSEATALPAPTDIAETEDLPPEMRRELERQRLIHEEKRVVEAQAEYRNRLASGSAGPARANAIQQRVQAYINEGKQSITPRKTAEGYGRYTDQTGSVQPASIPDAVRRAPPVATRKPAAVGIAPASSTLSTPVQLQQTAGHSTTSMPLPSSAATQPRMAPRPSAPSKPVALRTGASGQGNMSAYPPQTSQPLSATSGYSSAGADQRSRLAALLARDNEGVAAPGSSGMEAVTGRGGTNGADFEEFGVRNSDGQDWETDFDKRYPRLSGIDMVEMDMTGAGSQNIPRRGMRVKEV